MRVGIIVERDEEIEIYLEEMTEKRRVDIAGFHLYFGKLNGHTIVVVKCGAGKVNASACTQLLIDKFEVSIILSTGFAEAINPILSLKDIVISRDSIQHDVNAQALGFEKGRIPFTDLQVFPSHEKLIELAYSCTQELGLKAIKGRILTGDQFVKDDQIPIYLRRVFGGDCVDMESAAIAHVCRLNNIPKIGIRAISNKANRKAALSSDSLYAEAAKNSFLIVKKFISRIK